MLTQQNVDNLKRARELINNGWCQKSSARDSQGVPVPTDDLRAVAFCAIGACMRVGEINLAHSLRLPNGWTYLSAYNDSIARTKEDILALFDEAIERNLKAQIDINNGV